MTDMAAKLRLDLDAEWLEADGLGGFASGTVGTIRNRRYQALLLTATTPPTGRIVLVNGFEAMVETPDGSFALSSQRYAPDVVYPDGLDRIVAFTHEPWPIWTFRLPDGSVIEQDIFVVPDTCETVMRWRRVAGSTAWRLKLRFLLSGRGYHDLHRENGSFRFDAAVVGGNVSWRPYAGLPAIAALTNGTYIQNAEWFRKFLYAAERERGLDDIEDLASPGVFTFDLTDEPAVAILRTGDGLAVRAAAHAARLAEAEKDSRATLGSTIAQSVRSYCVDRGTSRTLIAGFPWFTDWGRDTFISMRGLILAMGDLATAEEILTGWADVVSEGMLPNLFPDSGSTPEYNSVDASLWYVVAVHDFHEACAAKGCSVSSETGERLKEACEAILEGYSEGTRFGIMADDDGLLRAGTPGLQMTWMDAKVGDHVITPRIGKPVEVQALWINALRIVAALWSPRWARLADRASTSFSQRYINGARGLFDVVDVDHVPGTIDARFRPNQIFAVGGLPFPVLSGTIARAIVDGVEAKLLTPLGLRTLSADDAGYVGHYGGGPVERDSAYHQGTAWPWLMGPFVDAWLSVRGRSEDAKAEARARFLAPLMAHLDQAGLGHVSEIADADPPHDPRGCPFQAWSLGELIRIRRMLDLEV